LDCGRREQLGFGVALTYSESGKLWGRPPPVWSSAILACGNPWLAAEGAGTKKHAGVSDSGRWLPGDWASGLGREWLDFKRDGKPIAVGARKKRELKGGRSGANGAEIYFVCMIWAHPEQGADEKNTQLRRSEHWGLPRWRETWGLEFVTINKRV